MEETQNAIQDSRKKREKEKERVDHCSARLEVLALLESEHQWKLSIMHMLLMEKQIKLEFLEQGYMHISHAA